MSEIYEALTNIGIAFLMLTFFIYKEDLATKHGIRPLKIVGFLFTPLVQFLLIGYSIYKKKVEKKGRCLKIVRIFNRWSCRYYSKDKIYLDYR